MALRGIAGFAILAVFAGGAAWHVIALGLADHWAADDPERALEWEPHNPTAMLALAQRHLVQHEPDAAAAVARELLRFEPLQGRAFALLAEAAEAKGETAKVKVLNELAMHRAPRDLKARAWLVDEQLRNGHFPEAIEQISLLLQIAPQQSGALFPVMVQLADVPGFASALSHALIEAPSWRAGMLSALLSRGSHESISAVYGALQREHALSSDELDRWLAQLMLAGRWGEAYSRWAGELSHAPNTPLPPLYNGRFETEPSSSGFDWRVGHTAGVTMSRDAVAGATGAFAMKVSLSGRRVSDINFEQSLLLAPGAYRLRFRARAEDLRSDKGVQWVISCQAQSKPITVSVLLNGKFEWKRVDTLFVVPEDNCPAQRLWLRNQGAAAAGMKIFGDIWFDDFSIDNEAASQALAPGQ